MHRVPSLYLPDTLPNPQAIQSFGDNRHGYEPEFWEFQYEVYRYLERVSDAVLAKRYTDILRNMRALISLERDVIPIQSFLSSWYWFRKEHQTRFEFFLRDVPVPVTPPHDVFFNNEARGAPVCPKHVNAGDVLFRYDKRLYIQAMVDQGQIRIRPASGFLQMEQDHARQDDECSKESFLAGSYSRITTKQGRDIPIIGDVRRTTSAPNYYVFCMTCDWDSALFADFDADSCIVVKDVECFARRLENAASAHLPEWYFHHNPVHYFDPYERTKNEYSNATMCKDFRFAHQREYRFLWFSQRGDEPDGFKFLELGSLQDLAELHRENVDRISDA